MNSRHARSIRIAIAALFLSPWAIEAQAQINVTSPASAAKLPAGPDHFTDVVGDPMDFNNADDFMSESLGTAGWAGSGPVLSGGRLTGTTVGGDNSVTLLHAGFQQGSLNLEPFFGANTPIDTTRFRRLSFRMKSTDAGEVPGVFFYRTPIPGTGGAPVTVYQLGTYGTTNDRVFNIDLTATGPAAGPTWASSNQAFGVRLDPNEVGNILSMELDWLRLTVADSHTDAVTTPIAWNGATGGVTIELMDAAGTVVLETIGTGASAGTFDWAHGYLAPGSYQIRVRESGPGGGTLVPITVNDPPLIHLTNPDQSGGEDWATAVKGNPWDMSSTNDIVLASNINSLTSDGSVLTGTSPSGNGDPTLSLALDDPTGIDNSYHRLTFRMRINTLFDLGTGSVARILFGDVLNDTSASVTSTTQDIILFDEFQTYFIDLSTLAFITGLEPGIPANYKTWDAMGTIRHFRLDPHEFAAQVSFDIDDVKLAKDDETVAGLFGIDWTVTDSDAEETRTVTLNYDNDTNAANGTLGQIGTGLAAVGRGTFSWNTASVTPGLYFIQAIVTDGTNTHSRYSTGPVRVVDPNTPANLTLTVGVTGSGSVTSNPAGISCGSDCSQLYPQGTNVTLTATPAAGSVFAGWSGDSVCQDGVAEMTAVRNCTATFATVLPSPPTPGSTDFNADGGGDALLYNSATGAYRTELDGRAFGTVAGTFSTGWEIQAADFDVDGRTDLFFYNSVSGAWFKGFSDGSGGFTFFGGSWSPGWTVTILDFNGDGRSDVFLYNTATGGWYRGTSLGDERGGFSFLTGTWSPSWGVFAADWNGDSVDDLFLYSVTGGEWFRVTTVGDTFSYSGGSWSTGWQVHTGDYDADGRTDVFLYNTATNAWFTGLNNGTDFSFTAGSWSTGWTVNRADLNADGRTDIFLYNTVTGGFFMCFSDGSGNFTYAGGTWSPSWRVFMTDYNTDQRADVLLYNDVSGEYFQGTNTGPGTFSYQGGNFGLGWDTIVTQRTITP